VLIIMYVVNRVCVMFADDDVIISGRAAVLHRSNGDTAAAAAAAAAGQQQPQLCELEFTARRASRTLPSKISSYVKHSPLSCGLN